MSVHGFFAFRIYTFTKKLYIPGLIWFMASMNLLGLIGIFVTSMRATSWGSYLAQFEWLPTTTWSISVACDVAITATLVVVLRSQQRSCVHRK
jgi:ABC-type spermidine/putrescine transport system permease subunit II